MHIIRCQILREIRLWKQNNITSTHSRENPKFKFEGHQKCFQFSFLLPVTQAWRLKRHLWPAGYTFFSVTQELWFISKSFENCWKLMKIVIIILAILMVVMITLAYLKGLYSPGHKDRISETIESQTGRTNSTSTWESLRFVKNAGYSWNNLF